jgi:tRNA(fMet)-specific endonuclease VapC
MRYTLDTNHLSALLRHDETTLRQIAQRITDQHEITFNAISYFETKRGLDLPRYARKHTIFVKLVEEYGMLALNTAVLDRAAMIYQDLRSKGTPLEDADILIAATAIEHDAILVTDNTKHFARVDGLKLENWVSR